MKQFLFSSSISSSADDEDDPPELKAEREKERRQANNARERYAGVSFFRIQFIFCFIHQHFLLV